MLNSILKPSEAISSRHRLQSSAALQLACLTLTFVISASPIRSPQGHSAAYRLPQPQRLPSPAQTSATLLESCGNSHAPTTEDQSCSPISGASSVMLGPSSPLCSPSNTIDPKGVANEVLHQRPTSSSYSNAARRQIDTGQVLRQCTGRPALSPRHAVESSLKATTSVSNRNWADGQEPDAVALCWNSHFGPAEQSASFDRVRVTGSRSWRDFYC